MATKILAIGTLSVPTSSPSVGAIMPREVPPTLKLYLDGHMEQFWVREGNTGVVFLMNTPTIDEAKTLLSALPLTAAKLMTFEYLPIGPLAPLGMLINGGHFADAGVQ